MYFLKMTKFMFIMRFVNITQYISHCFTSFTLGVVIKFLLIHVSSVVQPCRPLITFIVVMGLQSACFNG